VHFRPLRSLSALVFATAVLGLAPSARAAGANDAAALKLYTSAIDEDYLAADFAKAEKKLKDAVAKCGSGCSPEVLGKIHVGLGTVFSVGLSKNDDAKAEFILAIKADPKAALSPDLTTPELTKLFDEAKKAAGSGKSSDTSSKPAASGDATHTPPAESPVNTPLPLYVEPTDEVPLSKVTLRYKPFGATQYKSVELKKLGKGYGGMIPCEDVTTTGDIKYFFAFTGTDGEPAGGLGSNKEPFRSTIKNDIEGEAPKLPGQKPPKACTVKADCPPGLPGCEPIKPKDETNACAKRLDKGWGSSCETSCDCKEGLGCLNGTCEEDKGGTTPTPGGAKKKMNMVSVGAQFDFLIISSATDVCSLNSPAAANYACFNQGTSHQFFGKPVPVGQTNGVQGGGSFGDVRILAGYDRQILKNIGLSAGVRVGYAIGGSPTPDNVPAGANGALGFLPLHAEVRVSYHIFGSMLDKLKFNPYVFVMPIGFAQVNAGVPVTVCDAIKQAGDDTAKPCPGGTSWPRQLNAYQITGRNFSGFGVGTTFGFTGNFGLSAELKAMFMWPTFGVVIAPTIGPVFAF
jgi:hypothetical protein